MAKNIKRKTWKSSSTSSTEENFSPDDKRIKHNVSFTDSEPSSESDEVLTLLKMAETVMPKLDQVLEKLQKLEDQIQSVDEKVSSLQVKVESFEVFKKETETKIKELEDGLNFANAERESFKKNFQEIQSQVHLLRDEKLYMEVYQRRENLRFFGIKEEKDVNEDTREVLVDFLKTELGVEDADNIEFHRVHRVGKRTSSVESLDK
ncbi:tropomyosin-like [Montipora foliosa]|uniref:tropomyosin-like n=1 Tax=Montipora foliosa TaxID=591990 RepID=UPI0035F1A7CF